MVCKMHEISLSRGKYTNMRFTNRALCAIYRYLYNTLLDGKNERRSNGPTSRLSNVKVHELLKQQRYANDYEDNIIQTPAMKILARRMWVTPEILQREN